MTHWILPCKRLLAASMLLAACGGGTASADQGTPQASTPAPAPAPPDEPVPPVAPPADAGIGLVVCISENVPTQDMIRVNAILDDVKDVTAKVKQETERVDNAIHTTIDRIDNTAERVRLNVREKTSRVVGFIPSGTIR